MVEIDYREDTEGTVDTWETMDQRGGDNPGNFTVPPGAKMITGFTFEAAPDYTVVSIVRLATLIRLQGDAINLVNKPLGFVGPAGGITGTTEGVALTPPTKVFYPYLIPLIAGENQEFEAAFKFIGEDSGDVHGLMTVYYDMPMQILNLLYGIGGLLPVRAAQVREIDLAAANTRVRIDTDPIPDTPVATRDFRVAPGVQTLHHLAVAVGLDVAAATRYAHEVRIDGEGLQTDRKPQSFSCWSGFQGLDTINAVAMQARPEFVPIGLPLFSGKNWFAEGSMIEDDYGAGTIALGALYV